LKLKIVKDLFTTQTLDVAKKISMIGSVEFLINSVIGKRIEREGDYEKIISLKKPLAATKDFSKFICGPR